jgi:hypothetical protein
MVLWCNSEQGVNMQARLRQRPQGSFLDTTIGKAILDTKLKSDPLQLIERPRYLSYVKYVLRANRYMSDSTSARATSRFLAA